MGKASEHAKGRALKGGGKCEEAGGLGAAHRGPGNQPLGAGVLVWMMATLTRGSDDSAAGPILSYTGNMIRDAWGEKMTTFFKMMHPIGQF